MGSNPGLAQVLHFPSRRAELHPWSRAVPAWVMGARPHPAAPGASSHPPPTACTLLGTAFMAGDCSFPSCPQWFPLGCYFWFRTFFCGAVTEAGSVQPFLFGAIYLCRLCCLKGQACALHDNQLLLLSSSKAAAKTHHAANFIPGQQLPHPFLCRGAEHDPASPSPCFFYSFSPFLALSW